ncbi:heme A synthase [Croceicoccus naphthovorans]|nr:heme A synthase [Croceicoccus naphthovorans]
MLVLSLALLLIGALLIAQKRPRKVRVVDRVRNFAGAIVLVCGLVVFVGELV